MSRPYEDSVVFDGETLHADPRKCAYNALDFWQEFFNVKMLGEKPKERSIHVSVFDMGIGLNYFRQLLENDNDEGGEI